LIESEKERGRSRVLYWFRTPPGVKVGRTAFDPETQRSLERQNPDVQFDWPQITAARMPPPAPVESWREKRRAERAFKRARAAEAMEAAELERSAAAELAPDADEFDEPLAELEERFAEESPEMVEVSPEPVLEALAETAAELTSDSIQDTSPQNTLPPGSVEGGTQPSDGRRHRRRRRRRAGRSGNRPDAPAQDSAGPNERLDPADHPEKPSNEE
jgi:hypothetical protein